MAWPNDIPTSGRYGDWLLQLTGDTVLEDAGDLPDGAELFDAWLVTDPEDEEGPLWLYVWTGDDWQFMGNIRGPGGTGEPGPEGPQGPQGPEGPQGDQGPQGIQGVQGNPGTNGTNGTDGTNGLSVLSGAGAPGGEAGSNGDFYIDTSSYNIYGPKTAGAWGSPTPLVGPAGSVTDGDKGDVIVSGGGTVWEFDSSVVTAFAKTFLDDAAATDVRSTLGLAIGTNVQAYSSNLTTYAGITPSANVQSLLGAADYSAMRTLLSLVPGSDVQAYDAELAAIAGLTSAADKGIQFTGAGTAATFDLTTAGKALLDDADASAQRTTLGLAIGVNVQAYSSNLAAVASSGALLQGTYTIPVLAGAMTARTTNGAAAGLTESTTNKVMMRTLDFDQSTDEFAQIAIPMPKNWNEGTVTAQFCWTASATGNVVWTCAGAALSDDDAVDTAFGAAQSVTDSVTAAGDVMWSAATSAITIAGTPAAEDLVVFQFSRDADNGSDTLAADAKLIAVRLKYTINASDDT